MDQFGAKAAENADHFELMRLLEAAKPLMEPLFPDQIKDWAASSPIAQEIRAILAGHPEFYEEVRAKLGDVFPKPTT